MELKEQVAAPIFKALNSDQRSKAIGSRGLLHSKRRQIHFWINDGDYQFLHMAARSADESISRMLRRFIRNYRIALEKRTQDYSR